MKTKMHFWSYLAQFFLEREMFHRKFVEKIKTHSIFNNIFRKSCSLWDNVDTYCAAEQATDDSMAHKHCMPDT